MTEIQKQYYSVKELADLLGTSRVTVFKKIRSRQIKGEKVGRNYIIKKEDIKDFLTTKLTDEVKKEIDSGVVEVIKQYGEVLKKLGKE
ncbi:MAG: helix-turn-helix domain-containing protein [Candidatus Kerfeldbacteria bacterium]|nr:helix-turn-helix domain-containing protein [Candidatus Kerfeldbacteria bacterium]